MSGSREPPGLGISCSRVLPGRVVLVALVAPHTDVRQDMFLLVRAHELVALATVAGLAVGSALGAAGLAAVYPLQDSSDDIVPASMFGAFCDLLAHLGGRERGVGVLGGCTGGWQRGPGVLWRG